MQFRLSLGHLDMEGLLERFCLSCHRQGGRMAKKYTVTGGKAKLDIKAHEIEAGSGSMLRCTSNLDGFEQVKYGEPGTTVVSTGKGIVTTSLTSCRAWVYLYRPKGHYGGVAMFHAGSGAFDATLNKLPTKMSDVAAACPPGDIYVVIASQYDDDWDEPSKLLLGDGISDDHIIFYVNKIGWLGCFAASVDGCVGEFGGVLSKPVKTTTSQKKSNCYVTTATCKTLGLAEGCRELEKLRWFRDEVLLQSEAGRQEVEQYYAMAPALVKVIDALPNAEAVYSHIYWEAIRPAVAAVDAGDFETAQSIYRDAVRSLGKRFL